jgi:hypothetical protein
MKPRCVDRLIDFQLDGWSDVGNSFVLNNDRNSFDTVRQYHFGILYH